MEYKCKVKVAMDRFELYSIVLYYKRDTTYSFISRFKKYHIYESSIYETCDNNKDDVLCVMKQLNEMKDGEFMDYIKSIITQKEKTKLDKKTRQNEFYSEASKLHSRGRFKIKI